LEGAFEDNKALSIATAVLKGAESIASSYAAGAQIGGPLVGAAVAAVAAVTAAANVATVANTTKSSKSISGSSGSTAPTVPTATEGRGVTFVLNGDRNTPTTFGKIEDIANGLNDYYSSQGRAINIVYKGA
jgi:type IV secretory pathway TrbL component